MLQKIMDELVKKYRRNAEPELDQDYSAAEPFGKVRVGQKNLYWKRFLSEEFLPMDAVVRIYRRVEEVNGKTGCCSNDFSVHKLMVQTHDGQLREILIGEGLYRREPERLMECLQAKHPQIAYGKDAE